MGSGGRHGRERYSMKVQAEIEGEKCEVEVRRDGDTIFGTVDGRSYEMQVSRPEPGVMLFRNESKITEVFVAPDAKEKGAFNALVGGSEIPIKLIDPKKLRAGGGAGDQTDGVAEIRTAMPGKVVTILAPEGTEVEAGDGVIVVEAMKMQNELRSPKSGTVTAIKAEEGATVAAGQVLAVIE